MTGMRPAGLSIRLDTYWPGLKGRKSVASSGQGRIHLGFTRPECQSGRYTGTHELPALTPSTEPRALLTSRPLKRFVALSLCHSSRVSVDRFVTQARCSSSSMSIKPCHSSAVVVVTRVACSPKSVEFKERLVPGCMLRSGGGLNHAGWQASRSRGRRVRPPCPTPSRLLDRRHVFGPNADGWMMPVRSRLGYAFPIPLGA